MAETLEVTPAELDAFADRLGEVESYLHLDEKRTRCLLYTSLSPRDA